jgi:hypothetical protein
MAKTRISERFPKEAQPVGASAAGFGGGELAVSAPLNFKVTERFHREFKTYAAQHGVTMLELLQEGFRLVKERNG